MRTALLSMLCAGIASAQGVADLVKQGEEIFNKSCTAYCHGPKGATGGAPRLAGRGFDEAYINSVVTNGVPHTAMPGFGSTFPRRDVVAVVAYVATLNGLTPSLNAGGRGGPPPAPGPQLPADAAHGRDLFQDAFRRETRCSTCHEVNEIGIPVASPILQVPRDAAALRALSASAVSTVTVDGGAMPAVIVSQGKSKVVFYDLSSALPVMRTVDPAGVRVAGGSAWRHSAAAAAYTDAELGSILTWLRVAIPDAAPKPIAIHYHHTHFNSVDPGAAIAFYTTRFNGEKAQFAGSKDAVRVGKSWLLFDKVNQPPPSDLVASIYHIGWGAQDIKAAYQHQLDIGTKFETPLGDLADLLDSGTRGRGFYAYVDGPDHALIEMNGGASNNFQHVHLLSDDPVGAGEWFAKFMGITRNGPEQSRAARSNKHGIQIAPAVFMNVDGILFAWFPTQTVQGLYPKQWQGHTKLESNRGRVIDHIAFSVDHLDAMLERLRAGGVKITDAPGTIAGTKMRSAFIEGPDALRIELLEERNSP